MSLVIRVAIRFAQTLALTLLLAGVAGSVTVVRAGGLPEVACEEAGPWAAETIERADDLAAHGKKVDEASLSGDLNAAYALWLEAIDLLAAAAEQQADSDPPAGLEEINDQLAEAYADAAQGVVDYIEAASAYDQRAMTAATEDYLSAANSVKSAMQLVTSIADGCEDEGNDDNGRDRGDEPAPSGDLEIEVSGEIVTEDGGDPIDEAMMLVFEEGAACDEIDFEAFFAGETDQFFVGAVTDRSGEFSIEMEVEIGGEYAVLFTGPDHVGTCYDGIVFAEDEDTAEFTFDTVELTEADAR